MRLRLRAFFRGALQELVLKTSSVRELWVVGFGRSKGFYEGVQQVWRFRLGVSS